MAAKQRHFVDSVIAHARAGRGGDGCASFRREAFVPKGGPDGGDGGRGGDVILRANRNVDSLIDILYRNRLFAEDGVPGRGKKMVGRDGRDLVVDVPCGTLVLEEESGEQLHDIVEHGTEVVIARGGKGGFGNTRFKSSTHQTPVESTPGEEGEELRLRLELKVIADLGLVGYPNAGKSSLLAALSAARPQIASYPFTTLNPIIGTIQYDDGSSVTMADIPGIVEGAHEGVGLGLDFLRHISRARVLVFVVDTAGVDNREPWDDYRALRRELQLYDAELLKRPIILLANKMDMPAAHEKVALFEKRARRRVVRVSATTGEGIPKLREMIRKLVKPPIPLQSEARAARRIAAMDGDHELITPERLAQASFLDTGAEPQKRRRR